SIERSASVGSDGLRRAFRVSDRPGIRPSWVPVADRPILRNVATGSNAMQGSVVMLIALSGLGCEHKSCDVLQAPPTVDGRYGAHADYPTLAPSGHPAYAPLHYSGGDASGDSHRGSLRATLWSFVLGRDPDVPTAREIEATFSSGGYGHYRQLG